jgi:TRAP-type C4-dicarboxylate transport system permease small subunit
MLRLLDRIVEALLGAALVALLAIGGAQIFWRFVLNNPLSWALEASIVLLVWATMLSGYIGVRRNTHLSADFMGYAMRPITRWRLDLASLLLCVVFVAVYGWTSLAVIDAMSGIGFPSIPLPQTALYWALPVSAVLMALALAVRIRAHWPLLGELS